MLPPNEDDEEVTIFASGGHSLQESMFVGLVENNASIQRIQSKF